MADGSQLFSAAIIMKKQVPDSPLQNVLTTHDSSGGADFSHTESSVWKT